MGRKLVEGSLLSSLVYPLGLSLVEKIPHITQISNNLMLSTIYAGVIGGIGVGIVMKAEGSTGGLDIPPLILQKKLRELDAKLEAKQVKMTLTTEAFDHLLKEGFTLEYGAREMDRVIAQQLKPLLMREILFGSLKQGGEVTAGILNSQFSILKS